jgi:hypothetical protein
VGTGCEAAAENFAAEAEAAAAGVNVDVEVKVMFLERESMAISLPGQRVADAGVVGCGREGVVVLGS